MIILDASVLIAHFDAADAYHTRATQLLVKYRHHDFVASAITLAEFLVGPTRTDRTDTARQALFALEIQSLGLEASASWRLAELRALTQLKLPDCCVLYTAERHTDCLIATFDTQLAGQAKHLQIATAI